MKYCTKCGNELVDEAVICPKCGCAVEQIDPSANNMNETVILETKGSLLGGGMGKIILTNNNIMWTKSKIANFVAAGVFSFVTKGDTIVKLNTISNVSTWMFLGGGGLAIHTKDGKTYKFGFNSKKDRDVAMSYIQNNVL